MFSAKRKISIFFLIIVFLFGLVNFSFFAKQALAQAADPLSPAILLQQQLQNLTLQRLAAIAQHDEITLQVIDAQIKATKLQQKIQWLKDLGRKIWQEGVIRAGKIAYKNGLRILLSRVAYQTATYLATGDTGKAPLFQTKGISDFLLDVADTTLADTLGLLASTNGFFQFDVCKPGDINLRLAIHYSLFGNFNGRGPRGAPKCTFREIVERWDEWQTSTRDKGADFFLGQMKNAFKPTQTDVGIYLKLDSSIRSRLVDEQTKKLFDYVNNQGIKPVTEPITGFIRTPVPITKAGAEALATQGPISETITTGDIVADSIGIFTNTLAAKLLEQLFKKGLTGGKKAQSTLAFNWVNQQVQRAQANQVFANLAQVSYSFGQERILEPLTQCQNPQSPGPTECVMNSKLVGAIEQGLTVKEALDSGQLRGDGLVGYKANGQLTYLNDYPYRSLVIMRIHRILPVAWELAALYNLKAKKEVTLKYIIDCYEEKGDNAKDPKYPLSCSDMNGDGAVSDDEFNPYYHLIDPNWVLKSPESYCAKKSFGPEIVTSSMDCIEDNVAETRDLANNNELVEGAACESNLINPDIPVVTVTRSDDYCADRQSCLFVNDKGECDGEYGYCLKEQELSRFPEAKSCEPQFNTCETLTRTVDNKSFSYLRNTLKLCEAKDAGCLWYSTSQSKVNLAGQVGWQWNDDPKIYLNGQAKFCDSRDGGCTKLTRMIPGVNTAVNGDFNLPLEDSWQGSGCAVSQAAGEGVGGSALKMEIEREAACSASTIGYLPVDPFYTYVLTGAYRSGAGHSASVRVNSYSVLDNNGAQVLNQSLTAPNSSWQHFSFELNDLSAGVRYLKIILQAGGADGDFYFDNVQLVINRSPIVRDNLENFSVNPERYQTDYSQNDSYARTYLKQAPDYLGCELYNEVDRNARYLGETGQANCLSDGKYWRQDIGQCVRGGDSSCASFAAVCQQHEVGCQGYKPLNGDPEVSAVTGQGDVCPNVCVGYDSYLELPSNFDKIENPQVQPRYQNFIPETAQTCKAIDAGCEQFTNLDEVAKGGEGIEYFTKLRQCVSPNNASIRTYYTWEGSDTTGYQLKKWEFLGSNFDSGPCTNIGVGSEECVDNQDNQAWCSPDDIAAGNADCRDFFNKNNEHFFTLQSRAITSSGSCRPYRRTLTGQIYNADPAEGNSCAPAVNGCAEYKGNRGNNIKNIFTETFEKNQNLVGWQNSRGQVTGLERSNEAIYQGGHSLLVAADDNKVAYPLTGKLTSGKEYLLTFWAKKGRGQKVTPQGDPAPMDLLNFALNGVNLSGDWTLQTIGPVEFVSTGQAGAKLVLTVQNLGNDEVFYLDNVILKEFTNSFYVIKNSWNTPASCDTPYQGAFLGCQAYVDRQQQPHFLKGFANLCSNAAIGCEAFLDTRNSTAYQASHDYNEQTTVANDRIVYLVNDPSKQCAPAKQGCSLLGQPILDRQAGNATVIGYNNTYKINNPDLYSGGQGNILCNSNVLFCSAFNGEVSGDKAYFDPQLASGSTENTMKSCYYSSGKWLKNGGQEECPGAYISNKTSYIPSFDQPNYQGWVGICPQNQSTCTEFRNPQTPASEEVKQCDARLSPAWQGVCSIAEGGNGVRVSYNGKIYCQLNVNGVNNLVCEVTADSSCDYSFFDWICQGYEAAYYTQADIDNHPDQAQAEVWVVGQLKPKGGTSFPYSPDEMTGNCLVNNQQVCFIPDSDNDNGNEDRSSCAYSLLCQSDENYYLKNSVDKEATCTQVDRDAGCLLFNDTSNSNLDKSNKASQDGFGASGCNPNAAFGSQDYCDANTIVKVKKDRQCGEWLECKTGFEQPKASASGGSEFVCLDLYRCSKKGQGDNVCAKIVSTGQGSTPVYNLSASNNTTQIDQIKNLSGYSHPGLNWSGRVVTPGYKSPEQTLQKGQSMPIVNGGFETYLGSDLSKPEGWLAAWKGQDDINNSYLNFENQPPNCKAGLDLIPANVRSGRYSLRLDLVGSRAEDREGGIYCDFRSDAGSSDGYYQVSENNNYNLSFWAKSENGGQGFSAALVFFDNSGNHLSVSTTVANLDWRLSAQPPTQWKKYLISYGPNTDHLIPNGAIKMRIFFYNLSYLDPNNRSRRIGQGTVWFDDFQIEPVLDLGNGSIAKDCRLYPTEDAPACSYQGLTNKYEGWQGYCLEPDPAYQLDPLNPNNYQNCLQWYPVDSLLGDRLSVFSTQNIGYTDRSPLYYCAQTKGNYNLSWGDNNATFNSTSGYKYQSTLTIRNIGNGHQGFYNDYNNPNGNNIKANIILGSNGPLEGTAPNCIVDDSLSTDCLNRDESSCPSAGSRCESEEDDYGNFVRCNSVPYYCTSQAKASCQQDSYCSWDLSAFNMNRDHQLLTLDEIGAIEFVKLAETGAESGSNDFGNGGFFSEWTDDDVPKDLKKYPKVFTVTDGQYYRITLSFDKDLNDSALRLQRVDYVFNDPPGHESQAFAGAIYYYLKDQCSLIAQTVKLEGGVVKEKSWLGRLSNWVENNVLGYGKKTAEQPYGSFYPPKNSTPEYWSEPGPNDRKDAPLYVYSGGSFDFGPSAGTPWSVPASAAITDAAPGRICVSSSNTSIIGKECKTSSDCGGGVCGGIGKFCYNAQNISNGKACVSDGDCGDLTCRYPGTQQNPLAVNTTTAIGRLQNLFAKIYGVWKWDDTDGKYKSCQPFGAEDCSLGNINSMDVSEDSANVPLVNDVVVLGDNTLDAPGGKVELNFTVSGPTDQLPLDGIWIDWQDGNVDYFKGPFGYKPNTNLPYKAYHVYTCYTTDQGDRCVKCTNDSPADNQGRCIYSNPTVNVKDHWGWCANNGPRGLSGVGGAGEGGPVSEWVNEAACNPSSGKPADKNITVGAGG